MSELPIEECDDNVDEETFHCKQVMCYSKFDREKFLNETCPVPSIKPIQCIKIVNGTEVTKDACIPRHSYGNTDVAVLVRLGCSARFEACREKDVDTNDDDPRNYTAPQHLPTTSPNLSPTTTDHEAAAVPKVDKTYNASTLTIGLAVGFSVVFVVAVVVTVMLCRHRRQIKRKRNELDKMNHTEALNTGGNQVLGTNQYEDGRLHNGPRKESGAYETINDLADNYDHCKCPSQRSDTEEENTDTYDSLHEKKQTKLYVISDAVYDKTRDNTYDHLHSSKEAKTIPGTYDVLSGHSKR